MLLYRSCTRRCELLRRNQRQFSQVAAPLDGQVRESRATASSSCSCCSCRCCMMAELSRWRSCNVSSGAAARPPPPPPGRMHRCNVLPGALQACCMCLANPIPVKARCLVAHPGTSHQQAVPAAGFKSGCRNAASGQAERASPSPTGKTPWGYCAVAHTVASHGGRQTSSAAGLCCCGRPRAQPHKKALDVTSASKKHTCSYKLLPHAMPQYWRCIRAYEQSRLRSATVM